MSEMPQLLTLSGTVPGEPGVGGVILQDLQRQLPAETLQCVPAVAPQAVQLGWLERADDLSGHVLRRYETGYRPVSGFSGEVVGWLARRLLFRKHCRNLVTQICRHPAAQSCDKVWAVLDCPTVIQTALKVAQQLRKPLVTLVWDAPELLVSQFHMDRWSGAEMLNLFGRTLQASERIGVICEQMRQAYTAKFGVKSCVIMRHGIHESLWHSPQSPASDRLVIGFAGSITARQPFRRLIAMLDACQWRVSGRPVTLRLIGSRYTLDSRAPQHIEYFGWRSLDQTVQLLAECDVLYLPQPFEPDLRPLAELSFPTKLTTYLAAGRPVLLHAPDYGSITPFLVDYPVGRQCTTLDCDSLRTTLEQLVRRSGAELSDAIDSARRDEFSQTVFLHRFQQLAGVMDESEMISAATAGVAEQV
ncbi:MAG: glycosyltransferase [Fuerstiella sp.]